MHRTAISFPKPSALARGFMLAGANNNRANNNANFWRAGA
jgi:hypothetical protein